MDLLELNQQQQNSNGISDVDTNLINSISSKAGLLAVNRQDKINRLGAQVTTTNTDGDSGDTWRLAGADAPEVYHDNLNERNKVYQQYAQVNNVPIEMAKQQVDAEALAVKTAKDNGYDLPKQIEEARATGAMDANYQPTTFDMYRLGDRATEYANQDQVKNPGQGLLNSKFTGQTDAYNRALVENKDFTDRAIKSGYYVPGSTDPTEFANQQALMNQAQSSGQGLYDTAVNRTLMNNMNKNSYANHVNTPEQPQYNTSSDIGTAASSSIGVIGATVGDALADAGTAIARNVLKSNTPNTISPEEKLALANSKLKEVIDKSSLGEYFNTKQGQVNFSGLDEAKKSEYWGYGQSQALKDTSKDLADAYKSGNVAEMGKALASTILKPDVALEVLAGSLGEMGMAATGVGTALLIAGKTNDMLEARREITGKPSTNEDIAYATSMGIVYGLVNRFTRGNAGLATIKEATQSLTKNMTEVGLISTAQVLKDIAKGTGKAYGIEGGEEIIQDLAIEVGTKLGTSKENEVLNKENQAQLFTAFGLGGLAGGALHATVDVPRKTYEAYKNNKPLNEINKVAENLSPDEKSKVNEDLIQTQDVSNQTIQITQANLDALDSTDSLINLIESNQQQLNEIVNLENSNQAIDPSMQEFKNQDNQLKAGIASLTQKDAIQQSVDSVSDAILNVADNTASGINNATSLTSPNRNIIDAINESLKTLDIEPVENFSELKNIPKDSMSKMLSTMVKNGTYDLLTPMLRVLKAKSVDDVTKELIQAPDFKAKLKDVLTRSANNIKKDLEIVKFKQNAINSSTHANRQTKSGVSDTFNAEVLLNSKELKTMNGISKITPMLQEYDTATLKEIQASLPNYAGNKQLSKLNTALNDVLRIRAKAVKSESRLLGNPDDTAQPSDFTTDTNGVTTPTGTDTGTTSTDNQVPVEPSIDEQVFEQPDTNGIVPSIHDEITQSGMKVTNKTTDEIKQDLANIVENMCK